MGTVYVVERSEGGDGSINEHRVEREAAPLCHHEPVRMGPTHKHLNDKHICAMIVTHKTAVLTPE